MQEKRGYKNCELYDQLGRKEGRRAMDLQNCKGQTEGEEMGNINIIKDKTGKILFQDELINARWVEHFEELLNVENEKELQEVKRQ